MDFLNELGGLALGSRLKRLSETLMRDCSAFYVSQDVDFDASHMPVLNLLSQRGKMTISDITSELQVSQPRVTQLCNKLLKQGYLQSERDPRDERKKWVFIAPAGEHVLRQLQPMWRMIQAEVENLMDNAEHHLLKALQYVETELSEQDFLKRMHQAWDRQKREQQEAKMEILTYGDEMAEAFKTLNIEWLEKYFEVEPEDELILSHPRAEILDKGGHILMARYNGEWVGSVALLLHVPGEYEIAKLAVTERYQGLKLGQKLMQAAIEKAKALHAERVFLISNRKLLPALRLYQKLGFVEEPLAENPYARTDIQMALSLLQTVQ